VKPLILKPGREKSVLQKHPWLFSGAILQATDAPAGAAVAVESHKGVHLGYGLWNPKSQICCRMISFDKTPLEEAFRKHIRAAIDFRKKFVHESARRLINAEGDFLSGLIVDQYDDTLVIQIGSSGIDRLKPILLEELNAALSPKWIYERSASSSRVEEGLKPFEGTLTGTPKEPIIIKEDGLAFQVRPTSGQKTGFFLDQREMRRLVEALAKDRTVLNCFSYTGGFSLHALQGGAAACDSVDISKEAVEALNEHIAMNGFSARDQRAYASDVFLFLKNLPRTYDFIILDPPAFAKKRFDIKKAAAGYKEINRLAIKALPPGGLLLTCSCSYYIDEKLFQQILFGAALDAGREVQIIQEQHLALDHPKSVYHPEGGYLKSLLCRVL